MSDEKKRGGFIAGIVAELKKVTWLSWREAFRLTAMVLGVAIVVGLVLGGFDFAFSAIVDQLFVGG
jgi:preprotein translocase SecE subunit